MSQAFHSWSNSHRFPLNNVPSGTGSHQIHSMQPISSASYENGGSLPYSQQPATSPAPDPYQSSPSPTTHPISWRLLLILSSHLRLCLSSCSFPQVSPPKPCTHYFSHPYVPHAQPILFSSILSLEQYLLLSTYDAPTQHVTSFSPLLPAPS